MFRPELYKQRIKKHTSVIFNVVRVKNWIVSDFNYKIRTGFPRPLRISRERYIPFDLNLDEKTRWGIRDGNTSYE